MKLLTFQNIVPRALQKKNLLLTSHAHVNEMFAIFITDHYCYCCR